MDNKKKIFLAATADTDFWDLEADEIVFLGDWCHRYPQRHLLENLNYKVMSTWNSDEKIKNARLLIEETYEKILPRISELLNHYHSVNYEVNFWQILIGPWLQVYITIMYDHYYTLKEAIGSNANLRTIGIDQSCSSIASDFSEFVVLAYGSDHYNQYLFTRLIEELDPSIIESYKELSIVTMEAGHKKKRIKHRILKTVYRVQMILSKTSSMLFNHVYFSPKQQLKFWIFSLGKVGFINSSAKVNGYPPDLSLRNVLSASGQSENEFIKIVLKRWPYDMPTVYLEGFQELLRMSYQVYPKEYHSIISSIWGMDDIFKAYVGRCESKGSRLIGLQHGGYGTTEYIKGGHEFKILDKFYSWGWENACGKPQIIKAPASKLMGQYHKTKKGASKLLYVNTIAQLYNTGFLKTNIYQKLYYQDQVIFVEHVSSVVKKQLVIRPYGKLDHAYERFQELFPDIMLEHMEFNFNKSLAETRMCMIDHMNSTTMLEALNKNIPLLIFWRPEFNDFTEEAKPIFDLLKKVQIFHDSPESAALCLNDIHDNIEEWWNEAERQKAVQAFKDKFAYMPPDAFKWWLNEFKNIIREDKELKKNTNQKKTGMI